MEHFLGSGVDILPWPGLSSTFGKLRAVWHLLTKELDSLVPVLMPLNLNPSLVGSMFLGCFLENLILGARLDAEDAESLPLLNQDSIRQGQNEDSDNDG